MSERVTSRDLYRAATHMRADAFNEQADNAPFLKAVAAWLEHEAAQTDRRQQSVNRIMRGQWGHPGVPVEVSEHALSVALVYLDEVTR